MAVALTSRWSFDPGRIGVAQNCYGRQLLTLLYNDKLHGSEECCHASNVTVELWWSLYIKLSLLPT